MTQTDALEPDGNTDADASLKWRRPGACAANGCVEVASDGRRVLVRDGKDANSPVLTFTSDEWRAFISGAKNAEFDL